ncbi:MAG: bifunctional folylpolyglutamate synthase/dihydrofolate synthase [Chloroflexota bacterium]
MQAFAAASARISARICPGSRDDISPSAVRERATRKLGRLRSFLMELGSPERRLPVVHVTGTSGKGSTAAAIASLLGAAGLRTGLATSPYLQVMSEKLQIDGRLISGEGLLAAVEDVERAETDWIAAGNPPLAYGELWTALMLRWFDAEEVDAAVIEVGAGGRFDLTNVVTPIASVITSVGLDHLQTLGPTLADIAWHKAGIIKPGAAVVTGPLPPEGIAAVAAETSLASSPWVRAEQVPAATGNATGFVQANQRLALTTAETLAGAGLIAPDRIDPAALARVRLPGRLESMPSAGPPVMLDGAHNPDKALALAGELRRWRESSALQPVILFAAIGSKDAASVLGALAREASAFVLTEAPVLGKQAMPAGDLAALARDAGRPLPVTADPDLDAAFARALDLAQQTGTGLLVTGSLYLLGPIRRRWYPDEAVVLQRTPRPPPAAGAPNQKSGAYRK